MTFAVLGNAFVGNSIIEWYMELEKPWYLVPLWAFIVVGILYYIMAGTIVYRQLVNFTESKRRKTAFLLTIGMLAGNEVWNYLFFGLKSTFLGFISLIPFLMLVAGLAYTLKKVDLFSFVILIPYLFWLGYDLIWTYGLHMENI
ncbi:tryptophan-rich sensory protein [Halobacillus sp. A5]|nr:tryptophan-rich sensory protein [Halobacillus sp. A5]